MNVKVYREFKNRYGESFIQYVVPEKRRAAVLEIIHDSLWPGHLARDK